jgi:hypothetical protein
MASQYSDFEALHDYQQPGHEQRVSGWQSRSLKLTSHCRRRLLRERMEEKVSDQIEFSFVKRRLPLRAFSPRDQGRVFNDFTMFSVHVLAA